MKIVEVKHPLVKHKLGLMREHDISTKRFRELASEVGSLLTYEATADLATEKVTIEGWNGPVEVCLLYTSPSPRDTTISRMPSSA